jgi:hypothetical protein
MAKKFLVNLDLAKNQILNAAIQNLPSAPSSPVQGQVYYNTGDNRIYFWDGTSWIDMSGDIRDVIGGAGLTAATSNGVITLDVNVDNSTVEIATDTIRVKDGGITTAKLANVSTDLTTNSGSTAVPTAAAVKSYVDANIGGLGNLEGAWDASSGSFPVGSSPTAGTKSGDYWYVSVAGTTGGVAFNVGDVIIAKINSASTSSAADWIQLEVNRDQATETTLGLAEIATQSEVNAGTDDQRIVTPLKLKTYLDAAVGGYAANVGNASATSFALTHNLGTRDVIVAIYDNATYEEVMADVVATSTTVVTVSFAIAPSSNAYRVVIKK